MTAQQRQDIFSKEYLSINDIMELLGVSYGDAAEIIRRIRRTTDRLNINGKVHVQDYIDYFKLDIARYCCMSSIENKKE